MRIAIIGAGFCGLSAAWFLLQQKNCDVIIFDAKGIGGGASGMAAGLMHPYAGKYGRRSLYANEGMQATLELIAIAQEQIAEPILLSKGIIRHVENEEQRKVFLSHAKKYGDVEEISEDRFFLSSGVTIDCPSYLQGLWKAIEKRGGKLCKERVDSIDALAAFDQVIIAAGGGIRQFPECASLPIGVLKGQVLECSGSSLAHSEIGSGYIASRKESCYLGSTYEREFATEAPDSDIAQKELLPKIASFFPAVDKLTMIGCQAAMRVTRKGHYTPIAAQLSPRVWALTAMGSRGLLYHAYFGKTLAAAVGGL